MAGFLISLERCLVHRILERLASLEARSLRSSDLQRFARLRVAAGAGRTRTHFEGAEAGQRDRVARLEGTSDATQHGIDGATSISLGEAGGLGNMIDRVWHGYVVDMLDISPLLEYPVFNLADCFVVVGAVLGAVYYLWFYDKYDKKERAHGHKDPDGHN